MMSFALYRVPIVHVPFHVSLSAIIAQSLGLASNPNSAIGMITWVSTFVHLTVVSNKIINSV